MYHSIVPRYVNPTQTPPDGRIAASAARLRETGVMATPNMHAWAHRLGELGFYVFPLHTPIFDSAGNCTGCSCEHYMRSEENLARLTKLGREHEYDPAFKCETAGKHPRVGDWEGKATTDPIQIRKWWKRPWQTVDVETGRKVALYPNIGIAAGKSGLLVLDLDEYKANYGGSDLLTPEDEATVTVITGSGGRHLWYRMPEGARYGNETGELPKGIDIRGHGGLVVAPPSLHPSGRRYMFRGVNGE